MIAATDSRSQVASASRNGRAAPDHERVLVFDNAVGLRRDGNTENFARRAAKNRR